MAETAYANCGDLNLAYQVFGTGPVDRVVAGSFVSHVELYWAMPEFETFMSAAGFGDVVLFGVSEGGPAAVAVAATRPSRTRALILTGPAGSDHRTSH